jgi:cobalamin biosynthesis protein CobT
MDSLHIVFAGTRATDALKKQIEEKGGHVHIGLTKKTTLLVVKETARGSKTLAEARAKGIAEKSLEDFLATYSLSLEPKSPKKSEKAPKDEAKPEEPTTPKKDVEEEDVEEEDVEEEEAEDEVEDEDEEDEAEDEEEDEAEDEEEEEAEDEVEDEDEEDEAAEDEAEDEEDEAEDEEDEAEDEADKAAKAAEVESLKQAIASHNTLVKCLSELLEQKVAELKTMREKLSAMS